MKTAQPSPTILVIADDLKLVESLRGAFGSACRIMLSPSLTSGLERVHGDRSLCAVLLNLGLPGLDAQAAVSAVRAAHGDVTLLGFTPAKAGERDNVNGCQVVSLPVDWKDLRELVDLDRSHTIPSPALPHVAKNGHHPAKPAAEPLPLKLAAEEEVTPILPAIAVEDTEQEPEPEPSLNTTFLRDEAALLEHANFFEAFNAAENQKVSGRILRVNPHYIVCEVLDPRQLIAPGLVADEATIHLAHRLAYSGPARVTKVVNTGSSLICEWTLQAPWSGAAAASNASPATDPSTLAPFFERMNVLGRISEVFKAAIADVATVLDEARLCLDRIEVHLTLASGQSRAEALRAALPELQRELFPAFDQVFAKFELVSQDIPPDLEAEYHSLVRQRLHPLMMCAPFIHHVYAKPLGFAGDYAALNKLAGDPFEGQTLFAKLLNAWLILSPAGEAYRHRVLLLVDTLRKQAARCHQRGMDMRVLDIGCGPVNEVAHFFALEELSHSSEFTLVDFNAPTLAFAKQQVDAAKQEHWRLSRVTLVQATIQSFISDATRMKRKALSSFGPIARSSGYDFMYCTGLFDYFSDRVCGRIVEAMATMIAPGGQLVISNFTPRNPIRQIMKYVLDWNLVHRTPDQLRALMPEGLDYVMAESPGGTESYLLASRPVL